MHCHKVHHTMNQMGHGLPLMTGVDQAGVSDRLNQLVPGYMPMGSAGMGDMMEMGGMATPRNTLDMAGGTGPFGPISMGGMFTVLKIRENLRSYSEDPGWYARGSAAEPASAPHSHHGALSPEGSAAEYQAVRASACTMPARRR